MQKILSVPLSIIYYLLFLCIILVFHPIQWICFNLFGYKAHKRSVDLLNFFLVANTYLLGTRYRIEYPENLLQNVPLIIAANHQSMYDITTIGWFMRKIHPKFVSKIELSKGIPSISYNLNHGGSVVIDRKDPKQALSAIASLGKYIETNNRSAVIFPEGTRSRTGEPRRFAENGLKILCKYAPSAYMAPVTIHNSWKMTRWGIFPLGLGNELIVTIHPPFPVKEQSFAETFERTERAVIEGLALHSTSIFVS
ncbi:1-acyl-sn-glycerol-3-phosphate acyltransferase [Parabacteroides sp. PFB2-10]|uniref:lysophospholipid acyltransferase family protein n=1 Tax=Parabacteroides sp. PFB2-10 TaxID=1742405 RepID=UPI002475AEAD|nr:lysophospholipid acyltransferase family protein [Parabacteroides sp. PFB2-10]MDH6313914.1 1-acyl-sn-glycerol-3-phosphate acyltransferase [Parabacteroides sp. PFB2-10]